MATQDRTFHNQPAVLVSRTGQVWPVASIQVKIRECPLSFPPFALPPTPSLSPFPLLSGGVQTPWTPMDWRLGLSGWLPGLRVDIQQANRHSNRQTLKQSQADRQTGRQTDRQALYLAPTAANGRLLATHSQTPCHADHPPCDIDWSHVSSLWRHSMTSPASNKPYTLAPYFLLVLLLLYSTQFPREEN